MPTNMILDENEVQNIRKAKKCNAERRFLIKRNKIDKSQYDNKAEEE